jgi:hypothetical protein
METPPSITKFAAFVQLKDFRGPTTKEYVRYVRKCGEHYQCDPLTLSQYWNGTPLFWNGTPT